MYQRLIIEVTGCSAEDAMLIEDLMRDEFRTLDALSRSEFERVARECQQVLPEYKALLAA